MRRWEPGGGLNSQSSPKVLFLLKLCSRQWPLMAAEFEAEVVDSGKVSNVDFGQTFEFCRGPLCYAAGTAIALQLGHRASVDFDFISSQSFDPDELHHSLPFLQQSSPIQKTANTPSCVVDRGGDVHVSFFGTPAVRLLMPRYCP